MKKENRIQIVFIVYIIILTSIGCTPSTIEYTKSNMPLNVVSVKDYYDQLTVMALEWDENAYLERVEINVFSNMYSGNEPYMIAVFISPNKPRDSLSLTLNYSGSIVSHHFTHEVDIIYTTPIEIDDNFLDSPDAVLILADGEAIRSIMNDHLAKLNLVRMQVDENERLVWIFTQDFRSNYSKKFYLDAYTGEMLDITNYK